MADGRARPGAMLRRCPVCARSVDTHREPVTDGRKELVVYHHHYDTLRKTCRMSGKRAALAAVAFTGTQPQERIA